MFGRNSVVNLCVIVALLLTAAAADARRQPIAGPDNDILVRAPHTEIDGILSRHGLERVKCLDTGEIGQRVCHARAPLTASTEDIIDDILTMEPSVGGVEEVFEISLPEIYENLSLNLTTGGAFDALSNTSTVTFDGQEVWAGYVQQPAASLAKIEGGWKKNLGTDVVVAVIDSGIDPDHPLFEGRLVPGYDFLLDEPGDASEWTSLDQSTMAILGQSTMAILGSEEVVGLNQSTMAILGSSQASELDANDLPPGFGHGTMVAGMVRLAAPEAKIMPLRAFSADGKGTIANIVQAIYYAVDHGAAVINMSFSLEVFSEELMHAIKYADRNGVICVAAVGNDGANVSVYPADFLSVVGVASTNKVDQVSSFSNYGKHLVTLAAPGQEVITPFPGGGWASASGTSFASPLVAGLVALFTLENGTGVQGDLDFVEVTDALFYSDPVIGPRSDSVGFGRVNFFRALAKLQSLNIPGIGAN